MGGMCSWGMGVGSGGRWGESCSRRGTRRGIFWGMVIYVCVIALMASLASPSRLTGMVICVCVITMREPLTSLTRLTGMVICVCVMAMRAPLAFLLASQVWSFVYV